MPTAAIAALRAASRRRAQYMRVGEQCGRGSSTSQSREEILAPQAADGYWRCAAEGTTSILFDVDGETELTRFSLPRQNKEGGLCIADFFRDVTEGPRDVIGLQVVTMRRRASEAAREWFAENRYQDYLYLHGLSIEMAEAFAEYLHKRIRGQLGFAAEEARDPEAMLAQGYRGSRYSFGYPACPNLRRSEAAVGCSTPEIGITLSEGRPA
jgi:5-methyltetrahydrofolate--homocysteine methyltransferase